MNTATSIPKFTPFILLLKKPILIIPTASAVIAASTIVSFESMGYLLLWAFLCDFASGVAASYFDWKKSDHKDKWFFGTGEGFSSSKARKMLVKAIVYIGLPLLLIKLQQTLFLKNFKYNRLSDAEFEWATVALILFFGFEMFSVFHENLPRCGFNLWQIIKKLFGFYKEVKKEFKEE